MAGQPPIQDRLMDIRQLDHSPKSSFSAGIFYGLPGQTGLRAFCNVSVFIL